MTLFSNSRATTKARGLTSAAALALILSANVSLAFAQGTNVNLGAALIDVADQADFEILFAPELVENFTVTEYLTIGEPQALLTSLLSGTGLEFEETSPKVYVVKERPIDAPVIQTANSRSLAGKTVNTKITKLAQMDGVEAVSESTRVAAPVGGPAGVVEGTVTYSDTGRPLAGAIVYMEGTSLKATTDRRGEYRFPAAPAGQFTLVVDYLGTASQTGVVDVNSRQKSVVNFQMTSGVDEIVVTGQRSALMQALNQQRAADNSATVVSSDLIGSFPAETVSEALRRVSGVTFARDEATGEGSRISVRGFNSEAINVQLNGLELQGTGIERSVDLSGFLTENISQVTIQKALLPSHESNGSGGLVEIETKSGLDYGEQYLSFGIERESTLASGFGEEIQASATGAYKFTDDFGVVASLQYRDTNRDSYDIASSGSLPTVYPEGFTSLFFLPESFNFPFDEAFDDRLVTGINYVSRNRDQQNLTGSLNFAWDVADHTSLRLDLQRIENESKSSASRASQSFLGSFIDMPIPELGGEVRRQAYIRAFRPTVGLVDDISKLNTTSISFRGDTSIDKWDFDYKVGYSKAVTDRKLNSLSFISDQDTNVEDFIMPSTAIFNTDDDAGMTQRIIGGAASTIGDNIPVLNLTPAGRAIVDDPESYYLTFGSLADAKNPTTAYFGELKTRRNFNHKNLDYIEIGGKYKDTKRANSDDVLSNANITSSLSFTRVFGRETSLLDLNPAGLSFSDLSLIGANGLSVGSLGAFTSDQVIDRVQNLTVDDPNTPENEERFSVTDRTGNPIEFAGAISPAIIKEEVIAGYIQTKVRFGDLDVVGGVRFERENFLSSAISTPSVRAADGISEPRQTFIDLGLIDFVENKGSFDTWTPGLLATYRPTEQTTARLSYNRSTVNPDIRLLSRPPQIFVDLRPSFASVRIREANPDLKPSVADNFEFDLAYYFKGAPGLIRAGTFYKKISNNFTSVLLSDESVPASELRQRALDELAPLADVNPDLLDFPDNTAYFLNRPQNGEGGEIYGFELELIRQLDFLPKSLPGFVENFSVLGNLTYTTGDFPTLVSARDDEGEAITLSLDRYLLQQSEWAGNASLRYEDGGFSGSVIYTFQSASASAYDEFNLNTIIPEFSTLDARMSYTFDDAIGNSQIVLFAEGDNLLVGAEDADVRSGIGSKFGDGNTDFFFPTSQQFSGGRTVTVGAKIRF